jgi:hypothetical protein
MFVKDLKFKTAMKDAIGYHSGIQKFRDETRFEPDLDRIIEGGLRTNPARALKQIGVEDAEINAELSAIAEDEVALKKFVAEIPKFPIPSIDTR